MVLAADTLVAIDHEIIGKPADMKEATKTLRRLSGRTHTVCTAVFICQLARTRVSNFCEFSLVRFRRLTSNMIATYLTEN